MAKNITNREETKRQKFVRLANARAGTAVKQIELLGGLANKSAYDFTEADVSAIKVALDNATKATLDRLTKAVKGEKVPSTKGTGIIGG